ncbi:MAG: TAXI family TRAP transporter solute-binding subunit [Desulfobacteraceae bacterium]|nr:TAXI family TRAP transporter solute-binding subunit [Desulfobacteraceae bacterium]
MIPYKIIKSIWPTLAVLFTLSVSFTPAMAYDVFLGTQEQGTFSHYTGRLLERIIDQENKDINVKAAPGPGDIHNLTNLSQGSLDIALIDSRMLHDAINKVGNFKFLDINYQNLTIITPLHNVPVTLITGNNTSISKLDDLKGKRINIGAPLSSQNIFFNTIFTAKKWSKNDFKLVAEISDSQSQDTMAFCHGTIDAMIHIGVHPDSSLQQLYKLCRAKTIDMDDDDITKFINHHPSFSKFTIVSGTYSSQTRDIVTFGTQTLMVTSQDLDKGTVYTILDIMHKNRKRLSNSHPALALKKPDIRKMSQVGIKLHPGALKYFSDN